MIACVELNTEDKKTVRLSPTSFFMSLGQKTGHSHAVSMVTTSQRERLRSTSGSGASHEGFSSGLCKCDDSKLVQQASQRTAHQCFLLVRDTQLLILTLSEMIPKSISTEISSWVCFLNLTISWLEHHVCLASGSRSKEPPMLGKMWFCCTSSPPER